MSTIFAAVLLAGCGTAASATLAPTASPTAAPTASPTPTPPPTILSRAAYAADHITTSVKELMSLADNASIKAWIDRESKWSDSAADLPVIRPYLVALTKALIVLVDTPDADLSRTVLDIIAAARQVPGVVLP